MLYEVRYWNQVEKAVLVIQPENFHTEDKYFSQDAMIRQNRRRGSQ